MYSVTRTVVRCLTRFFRILYPQKYTDADPYKYILADPSEIEYTTGEIYSKRRGWVVDGNWDKCGEPYMQRPYARAIKQRFVDGLSWEETALSEQYDEPRVKKRGNEIEHLYNSIRESGYKSQYRLLREDPNTAWSSLNDAMHPLANEIAVDIGRNGEILWNLCGQHRLAIAKVLDIDRIPVQVFRRHAEWQAIRDRARRGEEIPEEFAEHPDLEDVLADESADR